MVKLKSAIITLGALWIVVHAALFSSLGIRLLYDSKVYIRCADYFLATGSFQYSHQLFYALPIVLLSFSRAIFADSVIPYLVLQMLLSAIAMVFLYKTAFNIFKNENVGFFAVLIFILWFDNIQWNTAILTESMFCSLSIVILYCTVTFNKSKKRFLILTFLMLALFFIRPTAIVVVLAVVVYIFTNHWHKAYFPAVYYASYILKPGLR